MQLIGRVPQEDVLGTRLEKTDVVWWKFIYIIFTWSVYVCIIYCVLLCTDVHDMYLLHLIFLKYMHILIYRYIYVCTIWCKHFEFYDLRISHCNDTSQWYMPSKFDCKTRAWSSTQQ